MTTTPEPATVDAFTGVVFGGRYRIDGLIGRGGMASVYRGTDTALGRAVAVKVFAETAEGIDDVARRRSEVALLASVEHRALVRLYDAARDDATGREYLVMELVDGRDLRETLRSGPLGAADAAGIAADIGEALHVIHARGIVHRDVKPANVLLEPAHLPTRTWNAKLADFGIARLIDDTRITRTGLLIGTPGFLSPEQVSGEAAGSATDVYALGLVAARGSHRSARVPGLRRRGHERAADPRPRHPRLLRPWMGRPAAGDDRARPRRTADRARGRGRCGAARPRVIRTLRRRGERLERRRRGIDGADLADADLADADTVAVAPPDDGTAPTRRLPTSTTAASRPLSEPDPVPTARTRIMTAPAATSPRTPRRRSEVGVGEAEGRSSRPSSSARPS